jgi:hypothetical protein
LARVLTSLGEQPVLARHPARLLHDRALGAERPIELVSGAVARIRPAFDRVQGSSALVGAGQALALAPALERASLAAMIRPLASSRLLALLDDANDAYA